jgi:HdeA/HdeB family
MRKFLILAAAGCAIGTSDARAQVPLSTYADANGYIDVQKLTCAQLAGTFQEDADLLTTWYSGWYNGLAKKHLANVDRAKRVEHEVIMYCKANPARLVIEAIAVVFKDERAKLGIRMKAE